MQTEAALTEHTRTDPLCDVLPQSLRWMPREVAQRLKNRKKPFAGQADEDMWRYIFGLLFPDSVDVPSPCKPSLTLHADFQQPHSQY